MQDDYEDLDELLDELNFSEMSLFENLNCQECSLPLKDYGYDSYIFGENDFADLILCGKCAADYCGEEDYHSEKLKDNFDIVIVKSNKIENFANMFPLSA